MNLNEASYLIGEFINSMQTYIGLIQLIMLPLGTFIAVIAMKSYRKSRLVDFKIEALTYAIEKELANNGFSKAYKDKLVELMKEYDFVNKK